MSIKLRQLGGDGFEIVLPSGKVIITNPAIRFSPSAPIKLEEVTGADYIAVSETGSNGVADIPELVKRFNSKVICCQEVGRILHGRPFVEMPFGNLDYANVIEVTGGNTIFFDDLTVEVKKGEHISLLQSFRIRYRLHFGKEASPDMSVADMRKAMPPATGGNPAPEAVDLLNRVEAAGLVHHAEILNFVFQTSDNLRIYYHFGGTYEFMRHEVAQAHPNVLIMQMYGNDPEEVAKFAAASAAEVVIPLGLGWPKGGAKERVEVVTKRLAELSPKAYFMKDIVPGKWYDIGVMVR